MSEIFKRAEKKDSDKINELFIEMSQTIYNKKEIKGYTSEQLDRYFNGGEDWICLAVKDNIIVAFLVIEVHRKDKEYIYLNDFCVTKEYRNNKIGTKMLNLAKEYAKKIKVNAICLHVEKSNALAFKLYEREGYGVCQEQNNRLLMVKEV